MQMEGRKATRILAIVIGVVQARAMGFLIGLFLTNAISV
jgi:hypothetical protein